MSINKTLVDGYQSLPCKVLQFGSGVFLRGYFDWMVEQMNKQGLFMGSAAMVKLTPRGNLDAYQTQDGVFQHIIRGMENGQVVNEVQTISAVQKWIHPYQEWDTFIATAQDPEIEIIVSNSTEAGIRYDQSAYPNACPDSFPAKLCAWLAARYEAQLPGVWVLPFELIESNGDTLREVVLQHASDWSLGDDCIQWLKESVHFVNTLVDRIVAAPSNEERAQLIEKHAVLDDQLLNASEPYHILVVDADPALEAVLPLQSAGLNVVYTDDLNAYRERKVKLLNGAHTSMLFLSYLNGNNTVEDSLNDALISDFLSNTLSEEIIPTIAMDKQELQEYAETVLERFRNPFLKHQLLSISLNSISKIQHRVLRSLRDAHEQGQGLAKRLALSFASMLYFYHGAWQGSTYQGKRNAEFYQIQDDADQVKKLADWWHAIDEGADLNKSLPQLMADTSLWGSDLTDIPGFVDLVHAYLDVLSAKGVPAAIAQAQA